MRVSYNGMGGDTDLPFQAARIEGRFPMPGCLLRCEDVQGVLVPVLRCAKGKLVCG